ncbi:hypothetical protein EVAR_38038_1 [Eumeta japonica]|uniref:Uncharacterized protein n=1 Tax=Eumeta variegata TaxID=151549 RepID=A0A4C1WAW1_EUMVA|nr:hypothetical protein EVAR_38038_1 [Eumeta japonica]
MPILIPTQCIERETNIKTKNSESALVYPSLGYPQNNDVLPQLWIQPPEMYPAQSTRLPQPADYGLDPNARPGVSFPNAQWHTPQYWN